MALEIDLVFADKKGLEKALNETAKISSHKIFYVMRNDQQTKGFAFENISFDLIFLHSSQMRAKLRENRNCLSFFFRLKTILKGRKIWDRKALRVHRNLHAAPKGPVDPKHS